MKELKERLGIEKQQWIENYMKKQVGYKRPKTEHQYTAKNTAGLVKIRLDAS